MDLASFCESMGMTVHLQTDVLQEVLKINRSSLGIISARTLLSLRVWIEDLLSLNFYHYNFLSSSYDIIIFCKLWFSLWILRLSTSLVLRIGFLKEV